MDNSIKVDINNPEAKIVIDRNFIQKYNCKRISHYIYNVEGNIHCKDLDVIIPINFNGEITVEDTLNVGKNLTIDCMTEDATTNNIHSCVSMEKPKYDDMYVRGSLKAREIMMWNYVTIKNIDKRY